MAPRTLLQTFFILLSLCLLTIGVARAHCDTMDGPVVKEAQTALDTGDISPVLKWVKKDAEQEVRRAFEETQVVRKKGPEARKLADRYFLETLVRVHRAGEGAPYTGLKPAGSELGLAVMDSDKALDTGSVEPLVKLVTDAAAKGIRERFARVLEAQKHANHNVDAGRKYVEAYVEYVHYVERLYNTAESEKTHAEQDNPATQHIHE